MYTLIQIDIDRCPHTLKTGIRDNILKISLDMTNEIVEFGYKKKPTHNNGSMQFQRQTKELFNVL